MIWLLALGCHMNRKDSPVDTADTCPGAPVTQIYWYPRDGNDIFEIQVDQPGEYALGLSSADWQGEGCGTSMTELDTCHRFAGQTLGLQTVETTAEVVLGESTWFKQERFDAWALFYSLGVGGDTAWFGPDTGGGNPDALACVGSGYPGCCTRDSSP